MPEFIRVRVKDSGTEQTIAKPAAVDPDVYEVLDEDATDSNGRLLPPKLPSEPSLEDLTIPELRAEIARRNEGRAEADQIPAAGNKSDLVAAIEADDKNKES